MTVRLREGTTPDAALSVLHNVLIDASSAGGGINQDQALETYLIWVERSEGQLRNIFGDPEIWRSLYSDIHWRIRRMGDTEPRPLPLIRLEVGRQIERLERLRLEIKVLQDWIGRSDGKCAVLDTNVLLHYLPPRQIDWHTLVGSDRVRLIVAIRVVEELDEKKYAGNDRLAKRARSVFSDIGDILLSGGDQYAAIRDGVSLEVAPFNEPRDRPLDADWEILTCCLTLSSYSPDLVLVTGDTAMRIRAQELSIGNRTMPSQFLRGASEILE